MKRKTAAILFLALLWGCTNQEFEKESPFPYEKYHLIQPSSIEPEGWIGQFLQTQRDGLTGHIEVAGHPFNTGMWKEVMALDRITQEQRERSLAWDGSPVEPDTGVFWWPYEQTGYYIDGAMKCGYLLGDSMLLDRARHQVYYLLEHPKESGRLGSARMIGRWFNWPYAGLFRAFMTEYMETGDRRLIEAMYRHYLTYSAEDFQDELDVCNVEELCWLFTLTGDSTLLRMGEEAYELFRSKRENRNRDGRDIVFSSDRNPDYHGVVYLEIVKIPAMLYAVTGDQEYLDEALHGLSKMERNHMLASGLPSTTEHLNPVSERAAHESCNLATLPYTYGTMLRVTGDASWADRIEKAVFNAGLGAITKDFKAHQYFSAPNQMIATTHSHHLGYFPAFMAYCPGHAVACCTGNINRMMPYYTMQMWLKTRNNGIAAALFGPSSVTSKTGEQMKEVTIHQRTRYPFGEVIEFEIEASSPSRFEFLIRIPEWCRKPGITLNSNPLDEDPRPGTFYSIEQKFSDGDLITLTLPMEVQTSNWPHKGISFERGPLVFSFPVKDSAVVAKAYEKSTPAFPAWDLFPEEPWAFSPQVADPKDVKVVTDDPAGYPWNPENPPVKLLVPARKVENWSLQSHIDPESGEVFKHISAFPEHLQLSPQTVTIELVPYGATMLRVTLFPQ